MCDAVTTTTSADTQLFGKVWPEEHLRQLPALALAYVGDAVYELYIRERLAEEGLTRTNTLHKSAVSYVKAQAQAARIHVMAPHLTQAEMAIVKRGRNAKSGSVPKGQTLSDYRWATGLEALVGYLFLSGQTSRLRELLNVSS